ncbi:MAG: glutamate 5-kinase [Verrucomicrobia subdivision 3 bacterium]|nr:glutamate 5-kinase [Limisphaerales bacterium]
MRAKLLMDTPLVVVKLGSGILTDARNRLAASRIKQLVAQIARARKGGREVVLVSSGAVAAGMEALGCKKRPSRLAELQACAAVGQSRLMARYEEFFATHKLQAAQVLLTHADLQDYDRHLNARNTLMALLDRGVVPVINENDAVTFTELTVGDNDKLSALVAALLPANLLVQLTTADGLVRNFGKSNARLISTVRNIDDSIRRLARGTQSATSIGGMASKVDAAQIAGRAGIPMVIANGVKRGQLTQVLAGENVGTLFVPGGDKLKGRKRWIAFFHHPAGALVVDDGAKAALRERGKSLLSMGIADCEGEFAAGDVVRVCDGNGTGFAQGITRFSKTEIENGNAGKVVVHRDDLVIL